jgi:uroporphyrinogen-III decarboxylase
MTTRERVLSVFSGNRPDRLPNVEFGYWTQTLERWHHEGLPADVTTDAEAEKFFGLEGTTIFAEVPVINGLHPRFPRVILEKHPDREIVIDEEGNTCEIITEHSSMPRYLKYGLQTREDWEKLKAERLDPDAPGRIGDLEKLIADAKASGMPIFFHAGSLYGWLRNWMGVEEFSYAVMSEREWVDEMMEHLTVLTISLLERVLPHVPVDLGWWWEDMCYNRGPLMSPALFRELMVPRYKRIIAVFRKYGIQTQILDCDGSIYQLVPDWLDAGIDCMFPLEVAHTDAFRLRNEHGDRLKLLGGVDKVALINGKEAIEREIERLIPLARAGRFIPCVDHRVPADVSMDNYRYYLELKQKKLLTAL